MTPASHYVNRAVLGGVVLGLLAGAVAWFAGAPQAAQVCWAVTTGLALLPLSVSVIREILAGHAGVDLIALLAMGGALMLEQYLAGAVIALMLSGGEALEDYADARARRELTALVTRTPRVVHRYEGQELAAPPIEDVQPGDRLLVKPGEVIPVDGVVEGEGAVIDEAALTGESVPVEKAEGDPVRSGTVNAASTPFTFRATATAERSTYAGIVRLVEEAQAAKAPLVRLADRYALFFLPLSLGLAGLAWLLSGDPVRALAVLVVATPCPLILAAPVAIVAGISRAARKGIIVKGGGALEVLGRGDVLVLDKTGTVTEGAPVLTDVVATGSLPPDELLRLAASVDLVSPHVLAAAIVKAARDRGLELTFPTEVVEDLGAGIRGKVGERIVSLGKASWVLHGEAPPTTLRKLRRRVLLEGSSAIFVAVDGRLAGAIVLDDPIRVDAPQTLRRLRRTGFDKIWMLTGDHADVAEVVGAALGVDRVLSERSPEEKVAAVREVLGDGTTIMVGDGINDAPALAAADVGVAMGARGATASSEAADVILLVDRLDRLDDAVRIARRSRGIALQSIWFGMGLSILGMIAAALGYLPPVAGALAQEVIDVAVIVNALRALSGPRGRRDQERFRLAGETVRQEHRELSPRLREIRSIADRLDRLPPAEAKRELQQVRQFLVEELLPHEKAEDARIYPLVATLIGGEDPTAPMSRGHLEIARLVRVYSSLLDEIGDDVPDAEDLRELRRVLYGLHAILKLHFAQEEESYLAIMD